MTVHGNAYAEVANMLCRDGKQWYVSQFTGVPRAQVLELLRARWPKEEDLRKYVEDGGSFHLMIEPIVCGGGPHG